MNSVERGALCYILIYTGVIDTECLLQTLHFLDFADSKCGSEQIKFSLHFCVISICLHVYIINCKCVHGSKMGIVTLTRFSMMPLFFPVQCVFLFSILNWCIRGDWGKEMVSGVTVWIICKLLGFCYYWQLSI